MTTETGLTLSMRTGSAALGAGLAVVLWAGATRSAPAADKVFTVGNYPVEAAAKNAVAAKDKAIAEGQQAAFRSLLKRIVPVTAYKSLDRVKAVRAADFVDGFSIRSEQNSPTQYIANLDFSFQGDAVRDLLSREGVPFVDEQAPPFVLVPVSRDAAAAPAEGATGSQGGVYRAASNGWNSAWKGLDLDNSVTPGRLEALVPVVHSDTISMLVGGDGSAVRIFSGEYKSDRVVVAISEIDVVAKKVNVTLAGQDASGPILWTKSYRIPDADTQYALELAAVVSLGVLEGRWKAAKSGGAAAGGPMMAASDIAFEVEFASTQEWNDIRGRILDMPGVDDVRVGAVSSRGAEMSVKYPGGASALSQALASQGLLLINADGIWQLRQR